MKRSPQRSRSMQRNYAKQLTAWIDVRARLVLREMLEQVGIVCGFECCRCYRPPVQKHEHDPFYFECACGWLQVHFGWTKNARILAASVAGSRRPLSAGRADA